MSLGHYGHCGQYSGFKLVTSTVVLSILEFIFIATSHKQLRFYQYIIETFRKKDSDADNDGKEQ